MTKHKSLQHLLKKPRESDTTSLMTNLSTSSCHDLISALLIPWIFISTGPSHLTLYLLIQLLSVRACMHACVHLRNYGMNV